MAVFVVSLEVLKGGGQFDYDPLWAELQRLGGLQTQSGVFLLNLANVPQQVTDHLRRFLDPDDRIMVQEMTGGRYWYVNALPGTTDWLKQNQPATL